MELNRTAKNAMNQATELSDRDLLLVRLRFLDLLKSFFQHQPDAQKISRWRGIFTALSMEHVNLQLDATIRELGEKLDTKDLQELKDEYYTLFIDPYSKNLLHVNASYYLDGKSFGPSLASYRQFLKDAQLIKDTTNTEPEDSLLLMLDALYTLIEEEKKGNERARDMEDHLLQQFLLPTVKHLNEAIAENEAADFFKSCIAFLDGYFELEQGLLTDTEPTSTQRR